MVAKLQSQALNLDLCPQCHALSVALNCHKRPLKWVLLELLAYHCTSEPLQWIHNLPPSRFFISSSWFTSALTQFPQNPLAQGHTYKYPIWFPFSLKGVYSIQAIYHQHTWALFRPQTFLPPEKNASCYLPPTAIQTTDFVKDLHPGLPSSWNPVHLATIQPPAPCSELR